MPWHQYNRYLWLQYRCSFHLCRGLRNTSICQTGSEYAAQLGNHMQEVRVIDHQEV
jgi:hypothetical protein